MGTVTHGSSLPRRCWPALVVLLLCPALVRADGGTLRFSKQCEGYRVTLFTAPTSLRAGMVDFSVLVQAVDSEAVLLDVPLTVYVFPAGAPQQRTGGPATTAAATNKLFRAIQLELSEPGVWQVEVVVGAPQRPARVETQLEIGPPLPSWIDLAVWIGWPAAAIVLFALHQWLVRRHGQYRSRSRRRATPESVDHFGQLG
jgi:hypothetical protein